MEAQRKIKFSFDITLGETTVMGAKPRMADAVDSVVTSFAPFLV
jgi:hypothetical protein